MAEHFASGTWQVKPGLEQDFVRRWTEFLRWTRQDHPAMLVATLLQDRAVPGHFVSFAEWTDEQSRDAWKRSPEFMGHFAACRALCQDMTGSDYDRAVSV